MTDKDLMTFMGSWFERVMLRFDRIDARIERIAMKEKLLDGDSLMDNQDVCQMLSISKRTLQRYRSMEELPYQMLYHKTFYKRSDVEAFMKSHMDTGETGEADGGEIAVDPPADTGNEQG